MVGRVSLAWLASVLTALLGCSESDRPERYAFGDQADGGAGEPTIELSDSGRPPPADAGGLCGNQILPVLVERPNVYFIVDRSGSMQNALLGSPYDKYTSAQLAIAEVLRVIGHRVAYGAAVFPAWGSGAACAAGEQVLKTQPGDDVSFALSGEDGPVLSELLRILSGYIPEGNTPTSLTLGALRETLMTLEGKTRVILATDGAPNCNPEFSCGPEDCMANLEAWPLSDGTSCGEAFNCCTPELYGYQACLDVAATEEVLGELLDAGVETYVVGLPGHEFFADVLDRLALAGGTARTSGSAYYSVDDSESLAEALRTIAVNIALSCTIDLESEPENWELVNVYLDQTAVPMNASQGWAQADRNSIRLMGEACDQLLSGEVFQVQIVFGCETIVR